MRKNNHYIYLLFFILLTISCRPSIVDEKIEQAETIVNENPIEALSIIDSLDSNILSVRQQANVEIIRGEARYRLDSIDERGDSLLSSAINFYLYDTEDWHNYRAYFLRAYELGIKEQYPEAIIDLYHAERSAKLRQDTLALGLIYRGIYDYFQRMEDNGTALTYAQKSYDMFSAIHSDVYEYWALFDLARAYGNIFENEKTVELLNECLQHAVEENNVPFMIRIVPYLGQKYTECKEYEKAKELFNTYRDFPQIANHAQFWLRMGRNYVFLNDIENAQICQDSLDQYDPDEIYLKFGIADKLRDYPLAYKYLNQGLNEQNELLTKVYQRDYSTIINNYFINEINDINHKAKVEKYIKYGILIVSLLLVSFLIFYIYKVRKFRKSEREESLANLKLLEETINNKNLFITNLEEEKESNINTAKSIIENLLTSRINEAEQLCQDYEAVPTDKKQQKIYQRINSILSDLKVGSSYIDDLENTLNHLMDNIMVKFRSDFPDLGKKDYALFIFILLGFSTHICCISQDLTLGSLYVMRSKLKKKIMAKENTLVDYNKYF